MGFGQLTPFSSLQISALGNKLVPMSTPNQCMKQTPGWLMSPLKYSHLRNEKQPLLTCYSGYNTEQDCSI